jgi:hypothetical protein
MEKFREVDNDELVDSIMTATLQCGLVVAKIQIKSNAVNIDIKDAERVVVLQRDKIIDESLANLKTQIEKQLDG